MSNEYAKLPPLLRAAGAGDDAKVKRLLKVRADVNGACTVRGVGGSTALHKHREAEAQRVERRRVEFAAEHGAHLVGRDAARAPAEADELQVRMAALDPGRILEVRDAGERRERARPVDGGDSCKLVMPSAARDDAAEDGGDRGAARHEAQRSWQRLGADARLHATMRRRRAKRCECEERGARARAQHVAVADFAMMRRATLAALVAVATANDPLYDYSASPLTELTDANFAETVSELRNCNTTLASPQSTDPPTLHRR